MRVLLADDNKMSLEYFSTIIDWKNQDFQLVSAAVDGYNALKDFEKFLPELVITDIEMPGMSGVELTQKIHEIAPNTVVIFLSSYSDFKYAQAALNLKVFDYLLKHETDQKIIIEKLNAVKKHIIQQSYQKRILAENEFQKALNKQKMMPSFTNQLTEKYDLIYIEQNHVLPIITRKFSYSSSEIDESTFKEVCYQTDSNIVAILKIAPYQYLVLKRASDDSLQIIYHLKDKLKYQLKYDYSIITICKASSIHLCLKKYSFLSKDLVQLYFYPISTIIDDKTFLPSKVSLSDEVNLLKSQSFQNVRSAAAHIEYLYLRIIRAKDYDAFNQLTDIYLSYILHRLLPAESGQITPEFYEKNQQFWCDAFSIYQWLKHWYTLYTDNPDKIENPKITKNEVGVLRYINENYMDSTLNLERIASALNISVSSLNAIAKKEMGYTAWQIIVKTRMENAAKLLRGSDYSVSNICEMVGYNSLSYFSNVFKKNYHTSPYGYRRQKI